MEELLADTLEVEKLLGYLLNTLLQFCLANEVCYSKLTLILKFLEEFDLSYHSLLGFLTLNKIILPDHIQDTNKTEQNPAHCTSIGLLRSTIST